MPVSMTYAVTPKPVAVYEYDALSGRARWSMRSRPQLGGFGCVVLALITPSSSTRVTRASVSNVVSSALRQRGREALQGVVVHVPDPAADATQQVGRDRRRSRPSAPA